MRQTVTVFAGVLLSGAAVFAADPQLMNLVMPDATILAGVNANSARSSPFGQFIIPRISALGPHLQELTGATGFDPLQDVSEVLAAANATDPSKPATCLVVVRGNFNVDKIAAASRETNHEVTTYGGATLITQEKPNAPALAFIGNSIAIGGTIGTVKAAIDRNSSSNSIDPALAARVSELSASQDEWVVSSVPVALLAPPNAPQPSGPATQVLPILKNIQAFSAGVKFGTDVQATAQASTSDPNNAAALSAVVRLLVNLAVSNSANAANDPHLAQLTQLLQTLQVTTSGAAVNLALSIPETQLESLVNSVPNHAAAPASTRPRVRQLPKGN
jgi:hypothetical protein